MLINNGFYKKYVQNFGPVLSLLENDRECTEKCFEGVVCSQSKLIASFCSNWIELTAVSVPTGMWFYNIALRVGFIAVFSYNGMHLGSHWSDRLVLRSTIHYRYLLKSNYML